MQIDKEISLMLKSSNGIVFKAVLVEHTLITSSVKGRRGKAPSKYEIKLYDTRFRHTPHGQFVTSYCASTLAGIPDESENLAFDFCIPDWTLSGPAVQQLVGLARAFA